jgi:putative acetyltransferase
MRPDPLRTASGAGRIRPDKPCAKLAAAAQNCGMLVRREQPGDVAAVQSIVATAFARPDTPDDAPVEVVLLDELRADDGWLPRLSLVAVALGGDEVVGHVVCTRGHVGDSPALGLGPLAVRPDRQQQESATR